MHVRTCLAAAAGLLLPLSVPALVHAQVTDETIFSSPIGSGARALGMGGAFIAIADDATASSWNPAGLCVLTRPEASVVWQPRSRFTDSFSPRLTTQTSPAFVSTSRIEPRGGHQAGGTLDFVSVSYPLRRGKWQLVPQVNFQRLADLGLDTGLNPAETSSTFRPVQGTPSSTTGTTRSRSQNAGGIDVFAASLGATFTPRLYLGVAFNVWRNGGSGTLTSLSTSTTTSGTVVTSSESNSTTETEQYLRGVNANVGLIFKPAEKLRLGLVYRTPFTMDYRSPRVTTTRTTIRSATGTVTATQETTTRIDTTGRIRWPRSMGAGLAFLPTDSLSLSVDYAVSNWAESRLTGTDTFQSTTTFSSPPGRPPSRTPPRDIPLDRDWPMGIDQVDTAQARFGVEYVLKRPPVLGLVALPLRGGFFTDQQFFKDTPDRSSVVYLGWSAGLGLVWSRVTADMAYVREAGDRMFYRETRTPVSGGDSVMIFKGAGPDDFSSYRFYVSTTVRF